MRKTRVKKLALKYFKNHLSREELDQRWQLCYIVIERKESVS